MCKLLLVRHPAPHPTESLPGYMLRLTEENGYPSPWWICLLAGLKQNEIRTSGFRIEKLAAISNQPPPRLEAIGFSAPPGQPRWARLLNHPVLPTDLLFTASRICPDCVSEIGFIEAHWHLRLMAVCPRHLRPALTWCSGCERALRWFRPALLKCECGATLNGQEGPRIRERDSALFEIMRAKALGCDFESEHTAGLPVNDLLRMNLRSLVALVRGLGKLQAILSSEPEPTDELSVVLSAAHVLRDWPENFMKLMADFAGRTGASAEAAAVKQFGAVYRTFFKNTAIKPPGQSDFLRKAFVEFLTNQWGKAYVDPKLLRHLDTGAGRRFISLAELATKMGVQQRTARRFLHAAAVPFERLKCGEAQRIIIDATVVRMPIRSHGAVLRNRAAAKRLGLPVAVVRALRDTNDFEVRYLPPSTPGWHEQDVAAFQRKVLLATQSTDSPFEEGVSFSRIMQTSHHSPDFKADIIRAVLSGDLPAQAGKAPGLTALQIHAGHLHRWFGEMSDRQLKDSRTPLEAARDLSCDRGCIRSLLRLGLLREVKTCVGLRIDYQSISAFKQEYTSLVSYARQLKTSTRGLMRRCAHLGIELLLIPISRRAGPQPFIRVSDAVRLIATA